MTDRVETRPIRPADRDAVVAFTRDTWPEGATDYVPRVIDEWIDADDGSRTVVATVDGDPVGLCQGVMLSTHEAWAQGIRVAADHRGSGIGTALSRDVFTWAANRGATVCRNMVFSWNAAGLGQSRSVGFEPLAAFRFAELEADASASTDAAGSAVEVRRSAPAAWRAFHGSEADRTLSGLGLALEESWALSELTPTRLADAETTVAVTDADGARGSTYRTRTFERDAGGGETVAEYGVGCWSDHAALRVLAAAVAEDAAAAGADRARVLVPETPRHVSDAAYVRLELADEPDFVLERDLTGA